MSSQVITTNRNIRRGLIGTLAIVLLVLVAVLGLKALPTLGGHTYTALVSEAGGLTSGNDVVASGLVVGRVTGIELDGNQVKVHFEITNGQFHLGSASTAAIITETVLGTRALQVTSAGTGDLTAPIPLSRTTPPYDVEAALADLTNTVTQLNTKQLAQALSTTGQLLHKVSPDLGSAITGVDRLSTVVNQRDSALQSLVQSASAVTQTLATRDTEIQALMGAGASLLNAVDQRRVALQNLITSVSDVSQQVTGFISDNQASTAPALAQLNTLLTTLNDNRANIAHGLKSAGPLMRELGEVVSAFPGFNVYIPNLIATGLVPGLPQLFGAGGTP